jgi:hypothetical protein
MTHRCSQTPATAMALVFAICVDETGSNSTFATLASADTVRKKNNVAW